jgi:pimeloyl-ACP methyl ester carboxylesterase
MRTYIQKKLHLLRNAFFHKAIASEYKKAGLSVSVATLSYGHVSYLANSKVAEHEAIVMLHGAGADKSSWVRFARFIGSQRRIVIPDLPGHGASIQEMSLDYGVQQQTIRLQEFLDALHIDKAHLIANSMGCAIALRLACKNPGVVSSLVLIDAAGVERTPSRLRAHIAETGKNPMIEINSAEDFRLMMRYGMASPPYIPGIFVNLLAEEKIKRGNIDLKILSDIEKDLDQTSILADIKAPTLIIWGAQDRVVHVDDADLLLEKIAGSKKLILDGVGHVPMVENPKLVATHCLSFLDGIAA